MPEKTAVVILAEGAEEMETVVSCFAMFLPVSHLFSLMAHV